jgi:RNA polymerase sigma factor (sigma-70 family)
MQPCRSRERRRDPSLNDFLRGVQPKLKRLLRSARIPDQDAEDLAQQTLMALVHRWDQVRNPEAWVVGALRKNCLMYWRSHRRRIYDAVDTSVLEWLAAPELPGQERRDLESDLNSALARLPERYRSVLRLRFGLGYKPPEVARRLGYRTSSIGKVTTRSLAALSRELSHAGFSAARAG